MFNIMIIMILSLILSMFMILINLLISKKKFFNREKISPFECGFDPICESRLPFSLQFYLISVIFLIFDVEIVLIIPMIYCLYLNNFFFCLITILIFLILLIFGLFNEWIEGALKWLK